MTDMGMARCLSPKMQDTFDTIRHVMHRLPAEMEFDDVPQLGMKTDFELAPQVMPPSAHLLVDVLANKLHLTACHGSVRILTKGEPQFHDHAWLVMRKDLEDFILDVRPVEMAGGPMILLNHMSRSFILGRFKRPERYQLHLDTVTEHVCRILRARSNKVEG